MKFKGYILLSLLITAATLPLAGQSIEVYTKALQKGQEAADRGDIETAVALWSEQIANPDNTITDPRIGRSLIELATKHERAGYYELGQNGYFWGLSNPGHPELEDELIDEIERLKPIASLDLFKDWRRLLKDGEYAELGDAIKLFWDRLDPTLDTSFNERFVEHWRRINHSKEHFRRNQSTVFNADERALIYVKLGEPDYVRDGTIGYNIGMVQTWVQDALKIRMTPDEIVATGSDSVSRATAAAQMRRSMAMKSSQILNFERQVRFKHRYPRYEIWVYKDILPENRRNLIYIFGDDGNTGEFGMRRSMEEMFPNSAFRTSFNGMRIPPSFFLQLMYYQEMITVDHYFADAFNELESKIYNINGVNRYDSQQLRSRNLSRLYQNQVRAPQQHSSILDDFPTIPVDVHQYRLLNDNNDPFLATFLFSRPHRAYYYDRMKSGSFSGSEKMYELAGFAMNTNESNEVLFKSSSRNQSLQPPGDFYGNVDNIRPEVTYFEVPNNPDFPNQKFTVELQHMGKDQNRFGDQLFKENLRAMGSVSVKQMEPIETDRSVLEMGDLILGVEESDAAGKPFGFKVEPDAEIANGENLIVHIEVYHLEGAPQEMVPFQIEYTVTEKKGFLRRLFSKRDRVRLALNFESRSPTFRENLEIDTSPFEPGKHTLELTAREHGSGREVSRTIEFTIGKRE